MYDFLSYVLILQWVSQILSRFTSAFKVYTPFEDVFPWYVWQHVPAGVWCKDSVDTGSSYVPSLGDTLWCDLAAELKTNIHTIYPSKMGDVFSWTFMEMSTICSPFLDLGCGITLMTFQHWELEQESDLVKSIRALVWIDSEIGKSHGSFNYLFV